MAWTGGSWSTYKGVQAELSGALCLLHSDKEPLSQSGGDSGCIAEENVTVRPAQTVSPRFGFRLWGSKRINPAMLQRPTEISQCVYAHVCEKGACHLLEGAYKVIVQHSAQILHWAALAHIFLRHISKTHNPPAMKNIEIMPLSASLVPFTKPNATSVSFPASSAVTSGPAKMSKEGLEWINKKSTFPQTQWSTSLLV